MLLLPQHRATPTSTRRDSNRLSESTRYDRPSSFSSGTCCRSRRSLLVHQGTATRTTIWRCRLLCRGWVRGGGRGGSRRRVGRRLLSHHRRVEDVGSTSLRRRHHGEEEVIGCFARKCVLRPKRGKAGVGETSRDGKIGGYRIAEIRGTNLPKSQPWTVHHAVHHHFHQTLLHCITVIMVECTGRDILTVICCIIVPPLGIYLKSEKFDADFWIALILWLFLFTCKYYLE